MRAIGWVGSDGFCEMANLDGYLIQHTWDSSPKSTLQELLSSSNDLAT